MIRILYMGIAFFGMLAITSGQVISQHKTYTTARVTGDAPVIDGRISETAWDAAPWEGGFIQREPSDGKPPTQNTEFKIIYDDEAIYVAIRAFDTQPELVDRRMTRRDDVDGDFIGVHIDSYFDRRTAFGFLVNAAGVKTDYLIFNDGDEDYSWDPVWYARTSIDSLGYIVELKIPYTQLRFAKDTDYRWGLEVGRMIFRDQELSLWQPIPRTSPGWVSEFGDLEGMSGIKPKREVELLPYAMAKVDVYSKEEGNPYSDGCDPGYNVGIDSKIAVTNDLTMNLTINPDFGQVEADPSVVNLTAFETFYKEKRPFFVEGMNIYNFNLTMGDGSMSQDNLFYTRRIGRSPQYVPDLEDGEYMKIPQNTTILGALKLSGKTRQGWSVGIMESVTQKETAMISKEGSEHKVTVEPLTNYYNTRLQKDFKQGKTILGGMFTATNRFINDSTVNYLCRGAYSGGLDFTNYWKDREYFFSMKGTFSYVTGSTESMIDIQESPVRYFQRPDATHLALDSNRTSLWGQGGTIEGGKQGGGNWRYVAWITWRSPGLELNDMGYLRQSDIIQQVLWAGYQIYEPVSIFRNLNVNFNQYSGWDFGGNYIYNGLNTNISSQFLNYWKFSFGMEYSFTYIDTKELRGGPALKTPANFGYWFQAATDERKKLNAIFGAYNRIAQHHNDRMLDFWLQLNYRPANALQFSLSPGYSIMDNAIQYVETVDLDGGEKYILGSIHREMLSANLRVNLNITPDLTIQYWGQPFVFAADYRTYKLASQTMADKYSDRFQTFSDNQISFDELNDVFNVDENMDGTTDYSFENPDFKVFEFRSNLVLRWEYIPGSTLYVVWSQGRMGDDPMGDFHFMDDFGNIFQEKASNIFLVKLSYRISI